MLDLYQKGHCIGTFLSPSTPRLRFEKHNSKSPSKCLNDSTKPLPPVIDALPQPCQTPFNPRQNSARRVSCDGHASPFRIYKLTNQSHVPLPALAVLRFDFISTMDSWQHPLGLIVATDIVFIIGISGPLAWRGELVVCRHGVISARRVCSLRQCCVHA